MCQDEDGTPKTGKQWKFDPLGDIKDMLINLDGIVDDVCVYVCMCVYVCVRERDRERGRERESERKRERESQALMHSLVLTVGHALHSS